MKNKKAANKFFQTSNSAEPRRLLLDEADVVRLGDLARQHGATRWKPAYAGKGRNANLLTLSLSANGIALYGHDSNAANHGDGNMMTKSVLEQLHADDLVITLDLAFETAQGVASGTV